MAHRKRLVLGIIVTLVSALTWAWWASRDAPDEAPSATQDALPTAAPSSQRPIESMSERETVSAPRPEGWSASNDKNGQQTGQSVAQLIENTLVRLQLLQSGDAETARQILRELIDHVLTSSPSQTGLAITAFLRAGEDVDTGLSFAVGPDGALSAWPTLRTALLDVLPAVDPLAALEVAGEIMDVTPSPDEYALALRNLAWSDVDGDLHDEMMYRFQQMLKVGEWRTAPQTGFLEAFDIPVAVGDAEAALGLVSVLAESVREEEAQSATLAYAAFMALDRIAVRDSAVIAQLYLNDRTLLERAPNYRASVMSRLNILDAEQQAAFLDYVTRPDHAEGELEYFSELYPNANYFLGNRLVTSDEKTPTIVQRQEADRRILMTIQGLDGSVQNLQARRVLERIAERMEEFTAQPVEQSDVDEDAAEPVVPESSGADDGPAATFADGPLMP